MKKVLFCALLCLWLTGETPAYGASVAANVTFRQTVTGLLVCQSSGCISFPVRVTATDVASMPKSGWGHSSEWLGSRLHVLGGENYTCGHRTDHFAYDPASNSWSTLAPMTTRRMQVDAVACGGDLYAIAGETGCSFRLTSHVEKYDGLADTWSTCAPLPKPISAYAAASVGGKIYIFGGCTEPGHVGSHDTYIYDPGTDRWSGGTGFPTVQGDINIVPCHTATVVGDEIYVAAGSMEIETPVNDDTYFLYSYNTNDNTWSQRAEVPFENRGHLWWGCIHIFAIDGYIAVMPDAERDGEVLLYLYSPVEDAWHAADTSQFSFYGHGHVQIAGDECGFYVLGGRKSGEKDTVQRAAFEGTGEPVIAFRPETLDLTDPGLISAEFLVWNAGPGQMQYTLEHLPDWVAGVEPPLGTSAGEHEANIHKLTIDRSALDIAVETRGQLSIVSGDAHNSPQMLNIVAVRGALETGFLPSIHGFRFKNWGTDYVLFKYGHCVGMTYAALYYYWLEAPLDVPTEVQRKYVEQLQRRHNADAIALNVKLKLSEWKSADIRRQYMAVRNTISATGRPCPIIVTNMSRGNPLGHALLVYRITETATQKRLWVYDSNTDIGQNHNMITIDVDPVTGTWSMQDYIGEGLSDDVYTRFAMSPPFFADDLPLAYSLHSPATLEVEDPAGRLYVMGDPDGYGIRIAEEDFDRDGHEEQIIGFGEPIPGTYQVRVAPLAGADPNETVTLEVADHGETTILLEHVRLADVPGDAIPYDSRPEFTLPETYCPQWPQGDLNMDCTVDFYDLAIMASNWLHSFAISGDEHRQDAP